MQPEALEALGNLMDGRGELAGAMANTELHTKRLMDQLRFLHTVLSDVHDLADEKSKTPLNNLGLIRIKAQVALRQAAQSGLLS
jgi:hypothetical protein